MVERTRSNGPQGAFLQAGKKFSSLQKLHSGPLIAPVPVGQIFWTMHAAEAITRAAEAITRAAEVVLVPGAAPSS